MRYRIKQRQKIILELHVHAIDMQITLPFLMIFKAKHLTKYYNAITMCVELSKQQNYKNLCTIKL